MLVRKLAAIYDLLSDTTDLFNRCFSLQAMLTLGSAFVYVIFAIFGLIHALAANIGVASFRVVLANMVYNVFCLVFIAQLVLPASLVNDEVSLVLFDIVSRVNARCIFRVKRHPLWFIKWLATYHTTSASRRSWKISPYNYCTTLQKYRVKCSTSTGRCSTRFALIELYRIWDHLGRSNNFGHLLL